MPGPACRAHLTAPPLPAPLKPCRQGTIFDVQAWLKSKHAGKLDKYRMKGRQTLRWKAAVGVRLLLPLLRAAEALPARNRCAWPSV